MTRFDSIVVGNDWVSEHWLAEQFPATVRTRRGEWKEREEAGKLTPRSELTKLATRFGGRLTRVREEIAAAAADRAAPAQEALRPLYQDVREALLLTGTEGPWTGERAGHEVVVDAVATSAVGGPHLVVLAAWDATAVEAVLDPETAGHLLTPATIDGQPVSETTKVVSELFGTAEPPALVLVMAGAWLLLAERGSWPEGRWLAVDLATVLDRRDVKAGGELETVAALLGADTLLPADDGTAPLFGLLEESVRHAVGVSKDLREGVRQSIELLAGEVLARRRERGLPSDVDGLAADLTRQSLRYLYRILFLLYAEARPELGVLPVGTPEYAQGYGLDRLRELVLNEVRGPAASGTHLYQSLGVLFRLVNDGYPPETLGPDGTPTPPDGDDGELRFEALRADLFSRDATALIDQVGLGNSCLQKVLERLLLSKRDRKRDRGFVSYAQLGINQLGAVYEGLMSYSGSIATEHMVEVARDPAKGSWVVPESMTADYDPKWFVERVNPETGVAERVRYAPGDFVFRLSGRDRQRSASYYTPEVLTRCVVTHSLAELLTDETPARDILDLKVCEPALGSGAFLVEAVNQLAAQYLSRRERELGATIDPEKKPAELQKVKAYIALHNCYGVDLNATAVELAEITLWLDCMHPGLRAPWFGLHLRRGNSLIGARRETWTPAEIAKRGWLTTVPTARPLGTAVDRYEVHHFLLPPAGWGAVADTKEAKEGRPKATATLKAWRKSMTAVLSKTELTRLQALGQRVEALWALALRRLEIAEAEIRRVIPVWGADDLAVGTGAVRREEIEASLTDAESAYRRLRRVMDAWAALWFWPVTTSVPLPTREDWISALEGLLGVTSKAETKLGRGMYGEDVTWAELDDVEFNERAFSAMKPVGEVLAEHSWLGVCEGISEREGFFQWELDFAAVFKARGGFDLQVGNPPWVRPQWDDDLVLAEDDAWFGLIEKASVTIVSGRRQHVLDDGDERYLKERASLAGAIGHLGSEVDRPLLAGLRPDLYRCFMDRAWRSAGTRGVVGLLHPLSHFTEERAGGLRRESYLRLRRLWQFKNELRLFEVGNQVVFGVCVYASARRPSFLYMASLFMPDTVDRSLLHDGCGLPPGVKDDEGRWDVRPHASRLIGVDEEVLAAWATIIDEPSTPPTEARMLRPVNLYIQSVLSRLTTAPRFGSMAYRWSRGWAENSAREKGYFVAKSSVPESLADVIVQGPHFAVATPYARQPNPTMRSNRDYSAWNLEDLPEWAIPRTNYRRVNAESEYLLGYPRWGDRSSSLFWRLAWRRMTVAGNERSLFAALVPPGLMHVDAVHTLSLGSRDMAVAAGMWASLPLDFLVRVSGVSKVQSDLIDRFPHPRDHCLTPELILRALRLNCLTGFYGPFWEELFDPTWQRDSWTRPVPSAPLGEVGKEWTMATPLRRDAERRQALVEIDALAAVMLGITAEELCAIYRTQFGVLRKYERVMQHDANGRQVPKDVLKEYERYGAKADLGRYELPFTPVDREVEMTIAHEEFSRRAAARG